MDFQDMTLFLQHLPTDSWSKDDMAVVIAKAFEYRAQFKYAQSHLN